MNTPLKKIIIGCVFFLAIFPLFAREVVVGIDKYDPPFIYSVNDKTYYGFDIDMINTLCRYLNYQCRFKLLAFSEIFDAVQQKKVDIAVSSIFITRERAQIVNFTRPYLISQTQFLAKKALSNLPFTYKTLNNKRFGYEKGTLIPLVIQSLSIQNPKLMAYDNNNEVVNAIIQGDVDYGLFSENAAIYWQSNAASHLALIGKPIPYGMGVGIAVNKSEPDLLNDFNRALDQFLNGPDFKSLYHKYIAHF
jgi:polar amino acid transport system substrate-binding protein